ncbi:YadA-like family protein (plasmid) [Burkholderia cenocepacia]|uniref:ESPR-type extended signal peptide-containing protein n=1 Tax=Burkholderia cenocepacia TaxID=95486 RepID=UPI001F2C894E|nr:ESPR-type extended signal peptide-containing protein [Burkholderia cenocepacia]UJH76242.1 YadA-like family protein [Burkholderia cenocepacia]
MNKTYRNIWNAATGTWTAVAETAKSHSKGSARVARQAVVALVLSGASIGGAFAADACTAADGTSGTFDEAGVCQVPVVSKGVRSIGTMATVDDAYLKVRGTTTASNATGTQSIAIGDGAIARNTSGAAGQTNIAIGANANTAGGFGQIAFGENASTQGAGNGGAIAIGRSATTTARGVALGDGASVTAAYGVALGDTSIADRTNSVSVGNATTGLTRQITNVSAGTQGTDAVNLGQMNAALAPKVDDTYVKVGGTVAATTSGNVSNIAIGSNANSTSNPANSPSIAMGWNSSSTNAGTIAIGSNATASASEAIALGLRSTASSANAVVLGGDSAATGLNSVALGTRSVADRDNSVSVGSAAQQRQITNMAAGMQDTDAVNVSQLEPVVAALGGNAAIDRTTGTVTGPTYNLAGGTQTTVGGALSALDSGLTTANNNITRNTTDIAQNTADITTINNQLGDLASGTIGIVQQDAATRDITVAKDTDGTVVDFTGTAGGRKLAGVAAGEVSATSNEAVNGSQLHGVSASVASAIGAGSTVNPDGSITAPSFTVGDGNGGSTIVHNVGDVVTNLDGRVTTNEGDIANLADQIGSGTVGLVQQDAATRNITVAKDTDGTVVDFTGTAGGRKLAGVAAGEVSAASNEAVNGSQLHGVSASVASAIGAGSTVNPDGSITAPSFTVGDGSGGTTTVHNVGDAVTNLDGRVTTNEGDIANLADQIGSGTVGLVQQDAATRNITVAKDTDGTVVDFTGTAGGRKLAGVAAGEVSATSNEAVNGSQLHGVSASVASAIGAGSTVNPDGSITAPSFTVGDGNGGSTIVHNVGDVVTNLDGRVTTNEGDIANLADQIGSGTVGLVQQDAATRNITVAKDTDGTVVDFTGTAGGRKLAGVAAGEVSATSNEAVNGSQLHGVSASVASAIGAGSTVNPDGSITAPSFTVGDGNGGSTIVHNVGDVVTNLDGRMTNNEGAIANLGDQLASGQIGLVRQDQTTGAIAVGATVGGSMVNFAGTNGPRTLSGVANGVNDSDAVTIAQLKATGLIDYTGKEIAAVTYDDISLGIVTFGGSSGTVLHNVGPGLIAAGSMDAVNGGQLYNLEQQFAQRYDQLSGQMNDLTDRVVGLEAGSGGGSGGNLGPGTGGDGSLVVGDGSLASGENSTAVGQGAVASGDNGSAFGQGSVASGSNGTAIGQGSAASGSDSAAVGQGAVASGDKGTAIGQGSNASASGSVAIGAGSVADQENTVSVGSAGNERKITNVAAGTADTDAVNVGQMNQRFGETNRMINDVAKNAYAGVAAAMAMPNLTPSQPGKTVVAVGAANYKSGSAVAAGATYRTRDGKWLMNGALSVTSTGDAGVRAQVGYEF